MIRVKTDIKGVLGSLTTKLGDFGPGNVHYDGLLRTVATTMIGVIKTRIHEQGKASDDTAIGQYSTKPMYVSLSESPLKFLAKGKNSDATFSVKKSSLSTKKISSEKVGVLKNGKIRKSGYFQGGYKQFKTEIGRNQLGTVNLSLTGQQNSQLTVQPTAKGYGLGWPDEEKLKRAKGQEKKYGKKIYALTESETQTVVKVSEQYLKDAISQ